MGGVVVDPIGDALMIDAEKAADFAQAEAIQVEAERLQAHFFVVAFVFG